MVDYPFLQDYMLLHVNAPGGFSVSGALIQVKPALRRTSEPAQQKYIFQKVNNEPRTSRLLRKKFKVLNNL